MLISLHFINRHWACTKYSKIKLSLEAADFQNLFGVIFKTVSFGSGRKTLHITATPQIMSLHS